MMMKRIFYIVYTIVALAFISCSGDIFDNIKEHAAEEKVYVGKFDKAVAFVGINRLEIDLLNAGRIPTDKISIGKAVKTVYEYDNKVFTCEGVQSWLNITDLKEAKLYRIKVYNIDEYGNKSIPVEVAAIPFTDTDLANLVVPVPEKLLAPVSAQLTWNNGLTSTFFDFYEMTYSYTDAQGVAQTDLSKDNKSLTLTNLAEGSAGSVKLRLKVLPKQNNVPILDTVYLEDVVEYQLPTKEQYLASRESRIVSDAFIDEKDGTITWGGSTTHLALSEVRYTTTDGSTNVLRILASASSLTCPNPKPGGLIETRSAFVPPTTTDTLYTEWKTFKYPFLYKYPRKDWTAESRNGNHPWGDGKGGQPALIFDGDVASGWHSKVGSPLPQCVVVDMKQSLPINHIMFQPPLTSGWCYIKDVEIYLSDTPITPDAPQPSWGTPILKLEYPYGAGQNWYIDFPAGSSARYVVLLFPTTTASTYISFMEFVVFGKGL
jgi:hypothetical protein